MRFRLALSQGLQSHLWLVAARRASPALELQRSPSQAPGSSHHAELGGASPVSAVLPPHPLTPGGRHHCLLSPSVL